MATIKIGEISFHTKNKHTDEGKMASRMVDCLIGKDGTPQLPVEIILNDKSKKRIEVVGTLLLEGVTFG